jgi:hypothetical protein
MATWNPFQNLCAEQVLNGNDVTPIRLIRPKNVKQKKNEQIDGNHFLEIVTAKELTAIQTQVKDIPQKPNYGEEGETIEFKTSFFYKDGCIKETEQMYDILKEVCAFLNNKGGVIYIGVEDRNGNIVSLNNDMNYLAIKSNEYKRKGKKISYFGRDGYIRWIDGCIRKKINLVKKYDIEINSKFDENGVLVITVPKGKMDVAKLDDGIAYVRRDCEAIKMTEEAEKELQLLRKEESTMPTHEKHAKELASIARHAMRCRKKVIVHNYSSGNSRKVSDRILEIFKCDLNNSYVYAYEISTGLVKQFKLCRAESIEILDEPWENQHKHICQNRDVFNMSYSNESPYENIEIEMSLRAKTLLEEEYPDSKKYLHELTQTKWSLKTTVANVLGVGRFCMGLLDEIQIINGERVRMYIHDCLQKQFYQYCLNQNMH